MLVEREIYPDACKITFKKITIQLPLHSNGLAEF